MDPFFAWIEDTAFSSYLREAPSVFVFPAMLVLHALGMALLVGAHAAIAVRVLGVAPRVPLPEMAKFVTVAWTGLAVNIFSGVLLLIAYPTKALTNPLFYVKMSLILLSLFLFAALSKRIFTAPREGAPLRARQLAAALLFTWASTIAAGRFLAYTYTRLLVNLYG